MKSSSGHLKITLTRGLVGKPETQRSVVRALGLKKFGSSVVHSASPTITGMLRKVHHLVTVHPAERSSGTMTCSAKKPGTAKARRQSASASNKKPAGTSEGNKEQEHVK